jgi:hypothetical protein
MEKGSSGKKPLPVGEFVDDVQPGHRPPSSFEVPAGVCLGAPEPPKAAVK